MTNASICEAKNNSTPMKSTLLGKRAPSDNVSSNSQLATRSIIHSKSYRRVKPRLSQPDNSRNERSRSLSSSVVSSDSVLSSTTFASEVLAASTSCSVDRHTGNKDEITVGSSDIETSSPSNSSSSSSSSSDSSSSRENTISDNGNNSGSLGCENVALSDFGKSCSDDKSDEIMNSSASDNTSANGGQNPRNGDELRNRLAAFLPQLAAANDALHNDVRDGYGEKYHIEKVDESKEQYVEMVRHFLTVSFHQSRY